MYKMQRSVIICMCLPLIWATPFQKITGRIINGERATEGQFPWQAGLILNYNASIAWLCGGTIIDQQWILTAGHCIERAEIARIVIGTLIWSNAAYQRVNSTEFILHEGYVSASAENDIGLIKLPESLNFSDTVQTIRLSQEPLGDDVSVTVSGWGSFSTGGIPSDDLNFLHLRTISNTDCQNIYQNDEIFDSMVCATAEDTSVNRIPCSGDGGGPVIIEGEVPELVAIVSFVGDEGCEVGGPSGYTRVASYIDWIRDKTGIAV